MTKISSIFNKVNVLSHNNKHVRGGGGNLLESFSSKLMAKIIATSIVSSSLVGLFGVNLAMAEYPA